jgi:hypothetical protein
MSFYKTRKRPLWKYLTNNPDIEYDIICSNGHKLTFGGGSLELDNKGKTICTASYGCVRCGAFGTIGEFGLQCVEQDPAPIQKVYHRFFTFLCPYKPRYVTFYSEKV